MRKMSETDPSFFFQINSTNLQRFSRRSVYFSRPSLLRLYDIEDGKICPAKKLQYFREPKLSEYPLDLNDSYESFHFFKLSNETKTLLTLQHEMTVSESEKALKNNGRSIDRIERTTVYTRRGILRYIMEFCYSGKFDSSILISRYGGKLYLFEIHGELQDHEKKPVFTHHSRLCRQLFVDKPNGLPNFDEPFDVCDTKHILHRSSLGKFDITYSGDVKGIISDAEFDKINDINALRTKRFAMAKQMWLHLKNQDLKFLNYWIQGYLANVEDLYMAYKDKNGVVREPIEHLKVSNIPKNRRWKPGVCTAFLNEFLERVEQLMWNVNSFETVYEFHFKGKEKTIHYEIHTGKPEKIAIPKEYIEFAKKQGC